MPFETKHLTEQLLRGGGGDDERPLVCVSLPLEKRDRIVDVLIEQGWRPVSLAITGEEQMLNLRPPIAVIDRETDPKFSKKLLQQGCQIVKWCELNLPEDSQFSTVIPEYDPKGRIAAEHFAERGFTSVACVRWAAFDEVTSMYDTFTNRAEELGMRVSVYEWETENDGKWWERYKRHADEFGSWLEEQGTPIGIFAADDRLAAVTCMYCMDLGVEIPVEVAILGSGNHPGLCKTSPVGISAISMDEEEMAEQIVELLSRGLAGDKPSHVTYKPTGITLRESTDVLASVDRNVAYALRFIWANYHKNISVDDIAQAVELKRFELERAFRRELGRGAGEELRRKRMEVFVHLLLTTDKPVTDLCCLTGFFTPSHLFRMFKRVYGLTPRRYREKMSEGS